MNYEISNLITWLRRLAEHVGLTDSQWTTLTGYLTLLGLFVSFVLVLLGVVALGAQMGPIIAEHKRKTALRNSALASVYQIDEIRGAVEYYIEPDCSPLDPASEEDLRQIIPVRTPLLRTLDGYLAQGGRRKYVLLLADSGMGKTSFLLNYFARHQLNHPSKNRGICLIPLNTENVEGKIAQLSDAKNTGIDPKEVTILLDAFDEDPAAQLDHRARLVTLMKACENFKNVVVTCRTQFFSSDEEIPKEPGVAVFAPLGAGDSGAYKFNKLYIAPFSDQQVSAYIKRRFPFWRFTHRHQAMDIVTTVSELSVRPMLLVAIPEIVEGRIDARHLVNLYEFLVEGWLERERKVGIRKEELRPFSEFLAVFIYLNRSRKKKPERLSRDQLRNLMSAHASAVDSWKFEQRSFLNRDASGNLKFAHRSIMEYLFVSAFFNGETKCLHNEWTDLMKHLFFSFVSSRGEDALKTLDKYSLADFGKTKLFPCFSLPRRSDVAISIDGKELLAPLSLKLAPGIPTQALREVIDACNVVQRWLLIESVEAGMLRITSYALDVAWYIPVDPRASDRESYDLFALDRYELKTDRHIPSSGAPQKRKRVRLPSVHEFDFIFNFSAGASFIGRDWLYWTSDSTAAEEPVLVSLGTKPLNNNYLIYLGPKQGMLPRVVSNTDLLHVYALKKEPVMLRDNMLKGVPIWVSTQGLRIPVQNEQGFHGYPPGGSNDILARMIAPKMSEQLGHNVVVDNRGGANAIIGSEIVAKAVPDGHTILIIGGSHVINPSVYPKLPYDTARDFAPIALLGDGSYVLVAHPSLALSSAADLIALTRNRPGQIVYASSGIGNLTHLAAELFNSLAGIRMLHVPYKGGNPAMLDLIGGRVAVSFSTVAVARPHLQSGKIKGLGVTTARRSLVLPNMPTIAESGLPGYEVSGWYGLVAPAATPKAAIARLHSVVVSALLQPEIKEKLLGVGVEVVDSTTAQFGSRINAELTKWDKIAKPLGITPE